MLLEFRVKNFRSFRDEAVLSLAASSDATLAKTHTSETGLDKVKRVLNSAAIYGANASGKSNIVRALQFMKFMVTTSNQIQPDQEHPLAPFRMRPDFADHPTRFEATFLIEGIRYQYGFEMTRHQVMSEWLFVYKTMKPQVWFSRTFDSGNGRPEYNFSDYFLGPKTSLAGQTRKEVLFLTNAVHLNNEQLKPIYQMFSDRIFILSDGPDVGFDFSTKYAQNTANKKRIEAIVAAADTGVSSVSFERRPGKHIKVDLELGLQEMENTELNVPYFGHVAEGEMYNFEIGEESAGTRILFNFSGPILNILQNGSVLIVDEIDRSLHPLLVNTIIQMFNDPELNTKGAQIVFTTHDVSLQDSHKLRRDQIWFTEKDNDQVSHLFSLLEFSPRKSEALEKGYLGGRYGGIPILRSLHAVKEQ